MHLVNRKNHFFSLCHIHPMPQSAIICTEQRNWTMNEQESNIIAVAILLAAYRGIGTNRIYNTQTGEVKWADPPEEKK